jgi:hypothetical protein
MAPAPEDGVTRRGLDPGDVDLLCDAMVADFASHGDELVWSSWRLESALDAAAAASGGVPEPLLAAAWRLLEPRALDRVTANFCRALGTFARVWKPAELPWDLTWMLAEGSDAQVALRYWTIAKRPELCSDERAASTERVLARSGVLP